MSDKKPSRYAASPEFRNACRTLGEQVGEITGKAEQAATAAVKKISKSALKRLNDKRGL